MAETQGEGFAGLRIQTAGIKRADIDSIGRLATGQGSCLDDAGEGDAATR